MADHSHRRAPFHVPHSDPSPFSRPATPGHQALHIGFVGLGAMGYPMARNLGKHRHGQTQQPLTVWNRTTARSDALRSELGEQAVTIASSAAQVALECDVIFTNLSNDEVVKSVYDQFSKALSARANRFHGLILSDTP